MTQRGKSPKKRYVRMLLTVDIISTSSAAIDTMKKYLVVAAGDIYMYHKSFKNRKVVCSIEEHELNIEERKELDRRIQKAEEIIKRFN